MTTPAATAATALERAVREDGPRVLATLIRHLGGDFELAEDALQDAYAAAVAVWPRDGIPAVPAAWLTTAARRRAIDRLRRGRALDERVRALEAIVERDGQRLVTDGPFAETKEILGGFYLIDVPDLDAALEWAGKMPNIAHGTVEVRPVQSFE